MIFSSYDFVFLFLPICLSIYYILVLVGSSFGIVFLVFASFVFYGWWDVNNLWIIALSIIFNYFTGLYLFNNRSKVVLFCAIVANLLLIFAYKYYSFFTETANLAFGFSNIVPHIILPIGISFFTFQQIGWIVDSYRKEVKNNSFMEYCLFVTFFPQLIAGPIVHHSSIIYQFIRGQKRASIPADFSIGCSMFLLGLAKKVLIADRLAPFSDAMFANAAAGVPVGFMGSWLGVLAYTFQIYFDFSAYSDMALGLGRLFGFRLPLNFNSPYRSKSIVEFWRRWHITLSAFLREYVYIALGGNRKGLLRRYVNLMGTMLLGGLWHGANWTFVVWGALHGLFLVVNHLWHAVADRCLGGVRMPPIPAQILTFIVVALAWVPFRSESFEVSSEIYRQLFAVGGNMIPSWMGDGLIYGVVEKKIIAQFVNLGLSNLYSSALAQVLIIFSAAVIAFFAPNIPQLFQEYHLPKGEKPQSVAARLRLLLWHPNFAWLAICVVCFCVSIVFMKRDAGFLYFQF
jgi:alginate O-acetyltransferase complex protein AlgI